MAFITLRQGSNWEMPASSRIVDRFHVLARRNGSQAIWFPSMAMLVTDDDSESARNFPYDDWRVSVIQESDRYALKQNHNPIKPGDNLSLVVLHRGEDWLFPASGNIVEKFHQIALEHGSCARWLPLAARLSPMIPMKRLVITHEDWRREALKAGQE